MKILVLGGTGAMGVPIVQILSESDYDVYVTTRREHSSQSKRIHYIIGDAQKTEFVVKILEEKFDAVIDFMVYKVEKFQERLNLYLANTKHYIFLSSSRVYADTDGALITEKSDRLLDVTMDEDYLKTMEYALTKAREENLLYESHYRNWTIIRPYITYNDSRLQLGVFEKEGWLQRVLDGKALVFSKDIASKYTTLTYAYDVALRIARLIGNPKAMGETFGIMTGKHVLWERVLEIYLDVLEKRLGTRPNVYWIENYSLIAKVYGNQYQIRYDRLYDRKFDNSKIQKFVSVEQSYTDVEDGLRMCLENFLDGDKKFLCKNWRAEGAFDRLTGEHTNIFSIQGWKSKLKYFLYRYLVW